MSRLATLAGFGFLCTAIIAVAALQHRAFGALFAIAVGAITFYYRLPTEPPLTDLKDTP